MQFSNLIGEAIRLNRLGRFGLWKMENLANFEKEIKTWRPDDCP